MTARDLPPAPQKRQRRLSNLGRRREAGLEPSYCGEDAVMPDLIEAALPAGQGALPTPVNADSFDVAVSTEAIITGGQEALPPLSCGKDDLAVRTLRPFGWSTNSDGEAVFVDIHKAFGEKQLTKMHALGDSHNDKLRMIDRPETAQPLTGASQSPHVLQAAPRCGGRFVGDAAPSAGHRTVLNRARVPVRIRRSPSSSTREGGPLRACVALAWRTWGQLFAREARPLFPVEPNNDGEAVFVDIHQSFGGKQLTKMLVLCDSHNDSIEMVDSLLDEARILTAEPFSGITTAVEAAKRHLAGLTAENLCLLQRLVDAVGPEAAAAAAVAMPAAASLQSGQEAVLEPSYYGEEAIMPDLIEAALPAGHGALPSPVNADSVDVAEWKEAALTGGQEACPSLLYGEDGFDLAVFDFLQPSYCGGWGSPDSPLGADFDYIDNRELDDMEALILDNAALCS
eukprot:SM000019S04960  [mRNA]  locus=s19:283739:287740:+ [translate_table: standard]